MGTLLTTRKMSPELRDRVERSVGASRTSSSRRLRMAARVLVLAGLAAAAWVVSTAVRAHARDKSELEARRGVFFDRLRAAEAMLGSDAPVFFAKVDPFVASLAKREYEGDVVDASLRSAPDWDRTLARPAVYVRGPIGGLASPGPIAETALASKKDALAYCLVDPPAARTEKAVLAKLRALQDSGGAADVRRLGDVERAVRGLGLSWADRARAARDVKEVDAIEADLARVPVEEAARAARAEILIVAADEPDEPGPTELDGERAHSVRLAIVDLRSGHVLLRLRRRVDPKWLGETTRITRATAADSCALAFDAHDAAVHFR
jgi:hypothetical protein